MNQLTDDIKELDNLKKYYDQTYSRLLKNPFLKGCEREIKKTNRSIFCIIEEIIKSGDFENDIVKNNSKYLFSAQKNILNKLVSKTLASK